jgi:hypothetical protein
MERASQNARSEEMKIQVMEIAGSGELEFLLKFEVPSPIRWERGKRSPVVGHICIAGFSRVFCE